jgi:hypothetical protein
MPDRPRRCRYAIGPSAAGTPAACTVLKEDVPYCAVFGMTEQAAQSEAARLIDRLNDLGEPVYVEVIGPGLAPRPDGGGGTVVSLAGRRR